MGPKAALDRFDRLAVRGKPGRAHSRHDPQASPSAQTSQTRKIFRRFGWRSVCRLLDRHRFVRVLRRANWPPILGPRAGGGRGGGLAFEQGFDGGWIGLSVETPPHRGSGSRPASGLIGFSRSQPVLVGLRKAGIGAQSCDHFDSRAARGGGSERCGPDRRARLGRRFARGRFLLSRPSEREWTTL